MEVTPIGVTDLVTEIIAPSLLTRLGYIDAKAGLSMKRLGINPEPLHVSGYYSLPGELSNAAYELLGSPELIVGDTRRDIVRQLMDVNVECSSFSAVTLVRGAGMHCFYDNAISLGLPVAKLTGGVYIALTDWLAGNDVFGIGVSGEAHAILIKAHRICADSFKETQRFVVPGVETSGLAFSEL